MRLARGMESSTAAAREAGDCSCAKRKVHANVQEKAVSKERKCVVLRAFIGKSITGSDVRGHGRDGGSATKGTKLHAGKRDYRKLALRNFWRKSSPSILITRHISCRRERMRSPMRSPRVSLRVAALAADRAPFAPAAGCCWRI